MAAAGWREEGGDLTVSSVSRLSVRKKDVEIGRRGAGVLCETVTVSQIDL